MQRGYGLVICADRRLRGLGIVRKAGRCVEDMER